jgi:hypothetical protein|tara:strand:+ start:524 stop:742 length:219 start_codon:yes stop_codon:yes gene_type:complete
MAKFEKHMMYGDGKAEMADTNAEHLKLKKKGWGHDSPAEYSPYKMRTPFRCWKGYKRVPGTKEFSDGSCKKA